MGSNYLLSVCEIVFMCIRMYQKGLKIKKRNVYVLNALVYSFL